MPETKICYNLSTAQRQLFCFPPDVIKYAIKDCNSLLWLRLIKSCKYFYAKHRVCVLQNAFLNEHGAVFTTDKDSSKRWADIADMPGEFYLIERFSISSPLIKLKPKIYKCLLRHLSISKIDVEFEDFKFLTSSKLFHNFEIHNANIVNSDKSIVQLEDIFAALPYVSTFIHEPVTDFIHKNKSINPQSFRKMAEELRYRMLEKFELTGIPQNANVIEFIKFVKNQAANKCKIVLTMNSENWALFKDVTDRMLKKWKPKSASPSIIYTNKPLIPRFPQFNTQTDEVILSFVIIE